MEYELFAILPAALSAAGSRAPATAAPSADVDAAGVAHFELSGVMYPESSRALAAAWQAAARDPSVRAMVLNVNSPGGHVAGTQHLSDAIFATRGSKPMHSRVDGMAASAGLWAASATGRILLSHQTDSVGSVGVLSRHVDVSGALSAQGVRITSVTSTPLKDAASSYRPLDEAGRAELQRAVDSNHAVFVGQLARNLGVSQPAIAKAATGQLFHGHEAIKAGLAHGFTGDNPVGHPVPMQPHKAQVVDVALRARNFINEQAALGRQVSAAEAVSHIHSTL